MTFRISIATDGAAFYPNARMELTAILRGVIANMDRGADMSRRKLLDSNGNFVGLVEWEDVRARGDDP